MYIDGAIGFKQDIKLTACMKHQRTLLMYAIRHDDYTLARYIVDHVDKEELESENVSCAEETNMLM